MPSTVASTAPHLPQVNPPQSAADRDGPPAARRGRVLVADDSRVTRTFVARLLEMADFTVDVAVDGRSGALAVCSGNYDLVLMDLEMPIMNGIDAAEVIRTSGLGVPIIALTASADLSDPFLCATAGMNGFLRKPFTLAAFEVEWERVRAEQQRAATIRVPQPGPR